jgi:hypothetical protein
VQLLKEKNNASLYLVVQTWTSIRKKEEEEVETEKDPNTQSIMTARFPVLP